MLETKDNCQPQSAVITTPTGQGESVSGNQQQAASGHSGAGNSEGVDNPNPLATNNILRNESGSDGNNDPPSRLAHSYNSQPCPICHSPCKLRPSDASADDKLPCLTHKEVEQLDRVIRVYKRKEPNYLCHMNIGRILDSLPPEIVERLKVVIATHEGDGLVTYFNNRYSHHVFILANTEDGITVFDPDIPYSTRMDSYSWGRRVYSEELITSSLSTRRALKSLPQFRILDGSFYLKHLTSCSTPAVAMASALQPEFGLNLGVSTRESPLREESFRVNLYEIIQLFAGDYSYESMTNSCGGWESPLGRLTEEDKEFLRGFYKRP